MAVRVKATWRRIVDVFFGLVLASSAVMSVLALTTLGKAGRPLIGLVQSRSMEASGILRGDAVLITPNGEYEPGDIIVFYRAPMQYGAPMDKDAVRDREIWVHEVIDRRVDDLGRLCYLTKGTSNTKHDTFYVPEDFVLGHGRPLPSAVGNALRFLLTPAGIILFIIMPSAMMFILLLWDLILLILTPPLPDPEVTPHVFAPAPMNPFAYVSRDKRPPPGADYGPKPRPIDLAVSSEPEVRRYRAAVAVGGEHLLVYFVRPGAPADLFANPLLTPDKHHMVCRVSVRGQRVLVSNAVFPTGGTSPMACLDWTRSLRCRTLPEQLADPCDAAGICRSLTSLLYDLARSSPILAVVELGTLPMPHRRALLEHLPTALAEGAEKSTTVEASAYATTPTGLVGIAEAALASV